MSPRLLQVYPVAKKGLYIMLKHLQLNVDVIVEEDLYDGGSAVHSQQPLCEVMLRMPT